MHYQIIERNGINILVKLTADNDYNENQIYSPSKDVKEEECLMEATRNFNEGIMSREAALEPKKAEEYPIVEVK